MRNSLITLYLLVFFCSFVNAQTEQNKIETSLGLKLGSNLSRPVTLPDESSIFFIPGNNYSLFLKLITGNTGVSIGFGYKSLNFNFKQKFESSIFYTETSTLLRMKYFGISVNMDLYLNQKKEIFIIFSGEYCWLIDDVNYDVFELKGGGEREIPHDIYHWYKSQMIFFHIGAGFKIKRNTILEFTIGFTPGKIKEPIKTFAGDYYGTWFINSERLLEFRVELIYSFIRFKF
jgi:hypothetical protein